MISPKLTKPLTIEALVEMMHLLKNPPLPQDPYYMVCPKDDWFYFWQLDMNHRVYEYHCVTWA